MENPETVAMMRFGDRLAALLVDVVAGEANQVAAHQVAMTVVAEAYRIGRADERLLHPSRETRT